MTFGSHCPLRFILLDIDSYLDVGIGQLCISLINHSRLTSVGLDHASSYPDSIAGPGGKIMTILFISSFRDGEFLEREFILDDLRLKKIIRVNLL